MILLPTRSCVTPLSDIHPLIWLHTFSSSNDGDLIAIISLRSATDSDANMPMRLSITLNYTSVVPLLLLRLRACLIMTLATPLSIALNEFVSFGIIPSATRPSALSSAKRSRSISGITLLSSSLS